MYTGNELQTRQRDISHFIQDGNVILCLYNRPILNVERGTTFGLAKLLYESTGGRGKMIGLRKRKSGVAFIITQEQTALTDPEYDIILREKADDRYALSIAPNYQDKCVNTCITVQSNYETWPSGSYSPRGQLVWNKETENSVRLTDGRHVGNRSFSLSQKSPPFFKDAEVLPPSNNQMPRVDKSFTVKINELQKATCRRDDVRSSSPPEDSTTTQSGPISPSISVSSSVESAESVGDSGHSSPSQVAHIALQEVLRMS